jgi:Ran GTPase-activating protein (RanGAP) involved in mRNA processing and transport
MVTEEGARSLAVGLTSNQTLTHLNLDHNAIGANGAQALSRVVRSHATLRVLSLAHNRLGDLGVVMLVEAIGHPACPVRVLTLAGNTINDTGLQALASVWTMGSLLHELDLRDNLFGDLSVTALTRALNTHTGAVALRRLWLAGNPCITDRDVIDALYDAATAHRIDTLCLGLDKELISGGQ